MIKCRNIKCDREAVSFIRIQLSSHGLDEDWPYCRKHYTEHYDKTYREDTTFGWHETMEGFRR